MNNIKKIYEKFGRIKQQLILRQEILPILARFDDVEENVEKGITYFLHEIFVDWFDSDVVRLNCVERKGQKKINHVVLIPYASIPAILLKKTHLSFEVIISKPLCVGKEHGKSVIIATIVELQCLTEKRRYKLKTNFNSYVENTNEKREGCVYEYVLDIEQEKA